MDLRTIRGLEERSFNAWPCLQSVLLDGWVLRLADGYTRRSNSINALAPGAMAPATLVAEAGAIFARHGVRPVFRLTPLTPAAMRDHLDAARWRLDERCAAMVAPSLDSAAFVKEMEISSACDPIWLDGYARASGLGQASAAKLARMLALLAVPAGFATLTHQGQPAAWGFAAIDRRMAGLYSLMVAPAMRGKGHGRRLVAGLMAFARENGARAAYLQVGGDNPTAGALYRAMGFQVAYDYTYHAPPD